MIIFILFIIIKCVVSIRNIPLFNQIYDYDVALIYYNPDQFTNLRCTGLLISPNIILTAAHCFENNYDSNNYIKPDDVKVYLGLKTVNDYYLKKNKQDVKKVIVHKNYHLTYSEFDIGIIVLEKSIPDFCEKPHYTIAPALDIIKFGGGYKLKSFPSYDECFFMGWGSPKLSIKNNKLNKKKIKKLLMGNDISTQKAFKQTMLFSNIVNSNDSPCNGDSGGPIICRYILNHKPHNYVVGVVSESSSLAPSDASPEEFCQKTDMMFGSSVGLHSMWLYDKIELYRDSKPC